MSRFAPAAARSSPRSPRAAERSSARRFSAIGSLFLSSRSTGPPRASRTTGEPSCSCGRAWPFPQGRTTFAVFDANRLRRAQRLTLDGDFSFDALSPDGRLLYLIEYVKPQNPTRYRVRALDLDSGRLLPGTIVDPREPDEAMRGFPITRETSSDGRWAYTLYDGAGAGIRSSTPSTRPAGLPPASTSTPSRAATTSTTSASPSPPTSVPSRSGRGTSRSRSSTRPPSR